MLELIVLPFTWLLFFLAGILIRYKSANYRSIVLWSISNLIIFSYCGFITWTFYFSLCLITIGSAYFIFYIKNKIYKKFILISSVAVFIVLIILFLKYRIYFNKYFLFLPSLSYFGFRSIESIIYQYKINSFKLSSTMLQTSFLPILMMGPITRVSDFGKDVYYDYEEVLKRLFYGLSMLIIGEWLGNYVIHKLLDSHGAFELWISAFANSFHIYFLFAGYTHLIIGIGLLVGIKLPENFNNPYLSTSITEFWRKWHMSLSFWIRDFLYIPFGGNRKGLSRKVINIVFAMIICGLWHGISLHYFLWGLFHGILLGIESIMTAYNFRPIKSFFPRFHTIIKTILIFILVTFSWILFTYNISDIIFCFKAMFLW